MRFAGPRGLGQVVLGALAVAGAASCASQTAATERALPGWFVERSAQLDADGFPQLENVPERVDANVDHAHWDAVTNDLDNAAAEMAASPRSASPPPAAEQEAAAEAFDTQAREDIERTRR